MKVLWVDRTVPKEKLVNLLETFFVQRGFKIELIREERGAIKFVVLPNSRDMPPKLFFKVTWSPSAFSIKLENIDVLELKYKLGLLTFPFGGNILFRKTVEWRDSLMKLLEELTYYIDSISA